MATYSPSWTNRREFRNFMAYATVTLFGLMVIIIFLMPLGYMSVTAFKDYQQVIDSNAPIFPMKPRVFKYEGQSYPLMQVNINGQVRELALVEKYNDESNFMDPANPTAPLINWKGFWGKLVPVMDFSPTYDNFGKAWNQVNFARLFQNTFIIAFLGTVGTVLSSTAVAYGFSRFRFPFKRVVFLILIATIILPNQVTLIPTYAFFRFIGWGGTWLPLIIPHFFANAYNVFLLRQYFSGIPKDLDEAAMIDGASPLRTLVSVILPQSLPALLAVSLFHFFFAWNDFFTPLVYLAGKEELYPIAVGLTQFNNIYQAQPGLAMAAAIMAIALPVGIFFFAQRIFMQGIVVTGVEK